MESPRNMRKRHLEEIYKNGKEYAYNYPSDNGQDANPYEPTSPDGITWLAGYLVGDAEFSTASENLDDAPEKKP